MYNNSIVVSERNLVILPIDANSSRRCIISSTTGNMLVANQATYDLVSLCAIPQTTDLLLEKLLGMGYSGANSDEIEKCINQLIELNILVSNDGGKHTNHTQATDVRCALSSPSTVYVSPTDRCNINCKYCYNKALKEDSIDDTDEMTFEEWEMIIRQLIDAKVKSIIITGGEPLLRQDLLGVWKTAKSAGIHVTLGTNGTLITDEVAAELSDAVSIASLSIDSFRSDSHDLARGTGTHDKVLGAIKTLNKYEIPWQGQTVVHGGNYKEVSETAIFVKSLGAIRHTSSFLISCGDAGGLCEVSGLEKELISGRINPDESQSMELQRGCGAGRSIASIDPYGRMYPCHLLQLPQYGSISLRSSEFSVEWKNSEGLKKYRDFQYESLKTCIDCKFFELCLGGCRGIAVLKSKIPEGFVGDMYCRRKKQRIVQIAIQKARNWLNAEGYDRDSLSLLTKDIGTCNE